MHAIFSGNLVDALYFLPRFQHDRCLLAGSASSSFIGHILGAERLWSGENLRTVQEMMRHKDPRSTEVHRTLAKDVSRREMLETRAELELVFRR